MEFLVGLVVGIAATGAIWWYVDGHGGAVAVEKTALQDAEKAIGRATTIPAGAVTGAVAAIEAEVRKV